MNPWKIRLIGLLAGLGCGTASAQNNSLFQNAGNRPPPPPANQAPAGNGTAPPPAPTNPIPTVSAVRPNAQPAQKGAPTITNPALAQISVIAVVAPEPEKIKLNDLVTIIVREDKQATTDATADTKKEWQVESALTNWFRIHDGKMVGQNLNSISPQVNYDYNDEYKTNGQVNRKDSLITRIQARVIDVKPNGNLTLEATKQIKMDDAEQLVTLTGTCRTMDITAQNTVLSTQVADLKIDVQHKGAAHDATQRGWIKRALDWAKPL